VTTDHATRSVTIGAAHSGEAKFCYCLRLQQVFIGAVDSNTPCLLFFVSIYQMAPPVTEVGDIQLHLTYCSSVDPEGIKAELAGWLTCSGRFTHISGHPSATGLVKDRKVRRPKTDVLPLCH